MRLAIFLAHLGVYFIAAVRDDCAKLSDGSKHGAQAGGRALLRYPISSTSSTSRYLNATSELQLLNLAAMLADKSRRPLEDDRSLVTNTEKGIREITPLEEVVRDMLQRAFDGMRGLNVTMGDVQCPSRDIGVRSNVLVCIIHDLVCSPPRVASGFAGFMTFPKLLEIKHVILQLRINVGAYETRWDHYSVIDVLYVRAWGVQLWVDGSSSYSNVEQAIGITRQTNRAARTYQTVTLRRLRCDDVQFHIANINGVPMKEVRVNSMSSVSHPDMYYLRETRTWVSVIEWILIICRDSLTRRGVLKGGADGLDKNSTHSTGISLSALAVSCACVYVCALPGETGSDTE